jgi:hypothetical protein
MNKRFLALPAMALVFACGLAQAQSFRCGGIGQAEQDQFKAEAAQHDALLTFALSTGAYVSDVDVRITDKAGKAVVQGRCDGPLMLVDLPGKGTYQVSATYEGMARSKSLAVKGKPARATFIWPAS